MKYNLSEAVVYDRGSEKTLTGGVVVIDRQDKKYHHARFNVMAIRMMGLNTSGKKIQFVRIGDQWFVKPTDAITGYKVMYGRKSHRRVCAKSFVDEFMLRTRYSAPVVKFRVRPTNAELQGDKLFLIDTSRPLSIVNKIKPTKNGSN